MKTLPTRIRSIQVVCSLAAIIALLASSCDSSTPIDDGEVAPYEVRCALLRDGKVKITIDGGITRRYCVFIPKQALLDDRTRMPVDGVGSGGEEMPIDGVGSGGSSECQHLLSETPHQHAFANKREHVCAQSEELSSQERDEFGQELTDLPGAIGNQSTEPGTQEPMVPNADSPPPLECDKDFSCGRRALGQDPLALYSCRDGVYDFVARCGVDCRFNGATLDDTCVDNMDLSEICSGPTNGLYCGQTLGLEEDVLYRCDDGVARVNERCTAGCEIMPPGEHDSCARCPSGNGYYCGNGEGDHGDTLFLCSGGVYRAEQQCDYGCVPAAPGFDDSCSMDSTCFPEQEGQVLVEHPWGACGAFDSICDEDGTQEREVGVCRQGEIVKELETRDCSRDTDGVPVSTASEFGPCEYASRCQEDGVQSRGVEVCQMGAPMMAMETRSCTRNTSGDACEEGGVCQGQMCVDPSMCDASDYWTPNSTTQTDLRGVQSNQTIDVELTLEFKDVGTNGNLEFRVCKYINNTPDNFVGDDIHVYFEDWSTHQGYAMIDAIVATQSTDHCTGWNSVSGESAFATTDTLAGQARIINPALASQDWGDWCSFTGMPSGTCWYINTSIMTRTCKL